MSDENVNPEEKSDLQEKFESTTDSAKGKVEQKGKEKVKDTAREAIKGGKGPKPPVGSPTPPALPAGGAAVPGAPAVGGAPVAGAGTTGVGAAGAGAGTTSAGAAGAGTASAASSSAAAAGTTAGGTVGAGVLWPVVLGIILLVYIIGVVAALLTIPSSMVSTAKKFFNSAITSILMYMGYTSNAEEAKKTEVQTVYSTADYVRKMGFNLYNDGFIYEKAEPSQNLKDEEIPDPAEDPEGFYLKDPSKLTKNDRYIEGDGIYVDPENRIRYIENYVGSPLYFYAWANTHTYLINDIEASYSNLRSKMAQSNIKERLGEDYLDKYYFPGMIVPRYKEFREDDLSFFQKTKWWIGRAAKFVFTRNSKVRIDLDNYKLKIESDGLDLTFNIEGWAGRYGLPINLLLALHKSTGAPDLVTELTLGNEREDDSKSDKVKYNIDILQMSSDIWFEYDFGDGPENVSKIVKKGYAGNANNTIATEDQTLYDDDDTEEDKAKKDAIVVLMENLNLSGTKEKYSKNNFNVISDSVLNHWYRNVYFNMDGTEDGGIKYVTYDVDYLIETGELWSKYNNAGVAQTDTETGVWSAYDDPSGEEITEGYPVTEEMFSEGGAPSEEVKAALETLGEQPLMLKRKSPDIGKQTQDARRGITNPRTKSLFTDYLWYRYDGTESKADAINADRERTDSALTKIGDTLSPETAKLKTPIDIRTSFQEAIDLIRNSRDLDSELAFRDFKELIVELGYYKKEELRKGIRKVMLWPFKDVSPGENWPNGRERKSSAKYGMELFSVEAIKNIYLKELKLESKRFIDIEESKADELEREAVALKTKETNAEDEKVIEEVNKKIDEAAKKRAKVEEFKANKAEDLEEKRKKFNEALEKALSEGTEENRSDKLRKALQKIEDPLLNKILKTYGEGYTEEDKVIAPVTGKVTYSTDSGGKPVVEIKALSQEDIDAGGLPDGYKEFYDSEYKGGLAGYTVKLLNVNKADPEGEDESTAYKRQIPKYMIDKLSKDKKDGGESDFDRVTRIEDAKKDAVPSAMVNGSLYVKEGTTIGVPARTAENQEPATIEIEDPEIAIEELEKIEGDRITMILIDADNAVNERLIEYMVEPNSKGAANAELDDSLRGYDAIEMLVTWMNEHYGLSSEAIAGILGNFMVESHISPTAISGITFEGTQDQLNQAEAAGGASPAIGLGQWLGGRKTALIDYAKEHYNGEWWHFQPQLEFAFGVDGDSGTLKAYAESATSSPEDNATEFEKKWERPEAGSTDERKAEAKAIYEIMKENNWLVEADSSKISNIGTLVDGMPLGMDGVNSGNNK